MGAIDYTKLLAKLNPEPGGEDVLRLRVGTVSVVNSDGTLNVAISGVVIPSIPRLQSAALNTGDVVQVISYRGSLLVIGLVAGNELGVSKGLTAYGQRNSAKSTANDGIEVGVMRLDGVPLKGGRSHLVQVSGLRVTGGGSTPHWLTTIRYSTSGAATIASTEVARSEGSTGTDNMPTMAALIQIVGGDVTGSFLLGLRRSGGTLAVTLVADNVGSNLMTVVDLGSVVPDTGIDL